METDCCFTDETVDDTFMSHLHIEEEEKSMATTDLNLRRSVSPLRDDEFDLRLGFPLTMTLEDEVPGPYRFKEVRLWSSSNPSSTDQRLIVIG